MDPTSLFVVSKMAAEAIQYFCAWLLRCANLPAWENDAGIATPRSAAQPQTRFPQPSRNTCWRIDAAAMSPTDQSPARPEKIPWNVCFPGRVQEARRSTKAIAAGCDLRPTAENKR